MKLFSYVIMDNHIHLIAASENLSKTMQSIKSYTSKHLIESFQAKNIDWLLNELKLGKADHKLNSTYQIWQEGFHPQEILTHEMMLQKIEYIHNNPIRRGYVRRPEDWLYSSASQILKGEIGLIELDELPI